MRDSPSDRVELTIPVDAAQRAYYRYQADYMHFGDVSKLYTRALLGEAAPDTAAGLLELAADYEAALRCFRRRCAASGRYVCFHAGLFRPAIRSISEAVLSCFRHNVSPSGRSY